MRSHRRAVLKVVLLAVLAAGSAFAQGTSEPSSEIDAQSTWDRLDSSGDHALATGNYSEAIRLWEDAYRIATEHSLWRSRGVSAHALGRLLLMQKRYREAEEYLRTSLTLEEEARKQHAEETRIVDLTAQTTLDLSAALERQGRTEEAEELLHRVETESDVGIETYHKHHTLAEFYRRQHRYTEARREYRAALSELNHYPCQIDKQATIHLEFVEAILEEAAESTTEGDDPHYLHQADSELATALSRLDDSSLGDFTLTAKTRRDLLRRRADVARRLGDFSLESRLNVEASEIEDRLAASDYWNWDAVVHWCAVESDGKCHCKRLSKEDSPFIIDR